MQYSKRVSDISNIQEQRYYIPSSIAETYERAEILSVYLVYIRFGGITSDFYSTGHNVKRNMFVPFVVKGQFFRISSKLKKNALETVLLLNRRKR